MRKLGKEKRRNKMMRYFLTCFAVIVISSCTSSSKESIGAEEPRGSTIPVKYAKGFELTQFEGYQLLTVKQSYKGNQETFNYYLTKDSANVSTNYDGKIIPVPIRSIAALSATYIPFIRLLDELPSIVAVSGKNTIYDSTVYTSVIDGSIKDLGEPELNVEQAILLDPDVIMGFAIDAKGLNRLKELERFGQDVIINSEYMESTPLAKAEWIKVFGALYDKNEYASSLFMEIETDYLRLRDIAQNTTIKPTVFTALPWKGTWYVPGGNSFQAALLNDAGANYLWSSNQESVSLPLDFESVIAKAINADYWLNVSTCRSLEDMLVIDKRFALFRAYQNKHVYNNTLTMTSYYGNDYWETGAARPDLILSDLIQIFHPDLYQAPFNYYERLD